jgi:SAM-dependent methyltransferase
MPEPGIARARAGQPAGGAPGSEAVDWRRLPYADGAFDTLFLLFAAHELRRPASREGFFRELRRVLAPGGLLLLVEHARDAANFAVFGPGFTHFLAAGEWRRLAALTGFDLAREHRMTPFVRVFHLRNPA